MASLTRVYMHCLSLDLVRPRLPIHAAQRRSREPERERRPEASVISGTTKLWTAGEGKAGAGARRSRLRLRLRERRRGGERERERERRRP